MKMNASKQLFRQQYGLGIWNSFDDAINRFRCIKDEEFTQLLPNAEANCDTPIFACKFAQQNGNESLVALANEDGKLVIHDTANQEERYGIRAHNNAIFDLSWMFDELKIVTASGDHTAKLFDAANGAITEICTFYGHSRSVKTVSVRKDDKSVFATGGRDGNIIIWDIRSNSGSFVGKADRTIFNPHNTKLTPSRSRKKCPYSNSASSYGAKSVTGLVFQNENTLISCGAGDGVIKVWDLRKNYVNYKNKPLPKSNIPYIGPTTKNGFSSLVVDNYGLKLYANCLDNVIYCYNLNTYNAEPIMKYSGHQNNSFYVKSTLSRDGRYLLSGSSDECAYIWNTDKSEPLVKLTGHTAEVNCVGWSDRNNILITCSDDMTHKIWRIGNTEVPENWNILGRGSAEPCSQPNRNLEGNTHLASTDCERVSLKRKPSIDDYCSNESKRHHSDFEPRKLFHKQQKDERQSEVITMGYLPNYVMDGVAPHLYCSPTKRKEKDWLTKMRIEAKFRTNVFETTPSAPKPRLGSPSTRRCASPQSPILMKFLKIKCDGSHSNKGSETMNVTKSVPRPYH